MSLVGLIGGYDNFDEVYESVIKDNMVWLESYLCLLKLVVFKVLVNNYKLLDILDSFFGVLWDVREYILWLDDLLLNMVLDLLGIFFFNFVEMNLLVMEMIVDLVICGYMSIDGWLVWSLNSYIYFEDEFEFELVEIIVEVV